jgi:hypothetical protein
MRARALTVAAFVLAMTACESGEGGEEADEPPPLEPPKEGTAEMPKTSCGAPSGRYLLRLLESSGTCGAQADSIITNSDPSPAFGKLASHCNVTSMRSTDGCTYDLDATCVQPQSSTERTVCSGCPPTRTIWRTHTTWDPSLEKAKGIWIFSVDSDVLPSCSSSYEVAIESLGR